MPVDSVALDIPSLPTVLTGPILRRLTGTSVAVWLALSRGSEVTLRVFEAADATRSTSASATPVRVGAHLWLVTVVAAAPGGQFTPGTRYGYRVTSPGWPAEPDWAALAVDGTGPSFVAPPAAMDDLVLLHTSCRKAHGGGTDALATMSDLVVEQVTASDPHARPHLMVLTGDQIYADEVPAPLAPRIRRVATDLIGVDETGLFGPLPKIGGRQGHSNDFGFTSEAATDQLWTWGEFLATYLLYWSPVLWPAQAPRWSDLTPGTDVDPAFDVNAVAWDDLADALDRFRSGLVKVRRLLANVPTLMILDDHEITDDWNLNYPWAQRVYADPKASRVVTNGLLAYVLCQHWGNTPERFSTAGTAEAAVLAAATFTGGSPDTPAIRSLIGLPTAPLPPPPCALRDLAAGQAIRYDVTVEPGTGYPCRLVLLDERTVREFHRADHPAARISLAGLAAMLPAPANPAPVTLVVTPSPAFGTHIIEHVIQPISSLLPGGAAFTDYESWSSATANHQDLIGRLAVHRPVVVLSGDVHYGSTASVTYHRQGSTARFTQLTTSAALNAETKTMLLHLIGDFAAKANIERARGYAGFGALSDAQRTALAFPPPAGTSLPLDDVVDIGLGRVFRAGQETPAVLSADVSTAYGFGAGDWNYEIDPVDDERMPTPGAALTAITGVPAPWPGWDPAKSQSTVLALRASDLHRIGRFWTGLPQVARVTFTMGPPIVVHEVLIGPVGLDAAADVRHRTQTQVTLW